MMPSGSRPDVACWVNAAATSPIGIRPELAATFRYVPAGMTPSGTRPVVLAAFVSVARGRRPIGARPAVAC
jgi:hypothetical protein